MDVIVDEISSTIEVASQEVLLDPAVLRRLVQAVTARLREENATIEWEAAERQVGPPRRRDR